MDYSFKINNDVLIISLQGRFDTEASAKLETELAEISKENPHGSLVIDASELSYIASSGLRIMLKMVKTEKNFRLENVFSDVYNVFEVTGFSKIIHITKALRKIDLEKCEKIGAGGNGAVYRISEDEIVKVNFNPDTYENLDKELAKAKEAFLLGIPTAISFDLVDCGEGRRGVVYEIIKSSTLGETIQKDPSRMEELTDKYIEQLHLIGRLQMC
jgi:anti-anti-sigma factor